MTLALVVLRAKNVPNSFELFCWHSVNETGCFPPLEKRFGDQLGSEIGIEPLNTAL